MQKSKNATLAIIILIFIYGLISELSLAAKFKNIYLYIINPLVWISIAIFLRKILGKNVENKKLKKEIIQYTLIAVLVYIITYMISGLFITFGKNPYSRTVKGVLINIWIFGSVIIAKEYIRFKLINNVYEKDKTKIAILISIIYILLEIQISKFLKNDLNIIIIITYTAQRIVPLIAKNILYSYIAMKKGFVASVYYELLTNLYLWLSPILPNSPWVMEAIINTSIPVILFLYIRYENNKKNYLIDRRTLIDTNPKNIIPLAVSIILVIWFALGIFPIKPVAIASGSMEKELFVGDVVIIKKCKPEDIIIGDIIEYQMNGYSVIHRVIDKRQKNKEFYYTTKGDNNFKKDDKEVSEDQLSGKVIFKIKYIGYPAILLNRLRNQPNIGVEI